jgi:hypothetical protein
MPDMAMIDARYLTRCCGRLESARRRSDPPCALVNSKSETALALQGDR